MSKFDLAAKIATKLAEVAVAAPKEHKMLQGMYRGYAGDLPQTLYHAGAAFNGAPRAGTFLNADKAAVKQFGNVTGAAKLHTFDARPRRGGTEADVIDMAKRMGIYDSSVPPGQYLEQGENAVFPEAAQMVDELHNMGIDHIVLADGLSNEPSVVVLDPSMVTRNNGVFLSPQKRVADYYAQKRSAQMGEAPHADMVLVDPFAGEKYNHATMGSGALPPIKTQARKVAPDDIQGRTNLYAQGGPVNKPQGMEHTRSEGQDASTQPLTGSALKALVRGWIAGTAGLPGDLEGLARKGVNWSFGPGGVNVDEAPALPTSEFYKGWLPGKQQGDEMINDIGSVFGGVGATKPVSLAKGALSRVAAAAPGPMAGSRAAMRGSVGYPTVESLKAKMLSSLRPIEGVEGSIFEPAQTTGISMTGKVDPAAAAYTGRVMPSVDPTDIRAMGSQRPLPVYHGSRVLSDTPMEPRTEHGYDQMFTQLADPRSKAYATTDPIIASQYARTKLGEMGERPNLRAYVGQGFPYVYSSDIDNVDLGALLEGLSKNQKIALFKTYDIQRNGLRTGPLPWDYTIGDTNKLGELTRNLVAYPDSIANVKSINPSFAEAVRLAKEKHIASLPENYLFNMEDHAGYDASGDQILKKMTQLILTNPGEAIRSGQLTPLKGGYAQGGAVKDSVKATPPSNELMRLLAEKLGQADAFARKPFGYDNPPVEMISDFLGIPAAQRTMERVAYGEPLTTGKGMTTRMRPDTEEALLASAGLIQPAGALTRVAGQAANKVGKAGERLAERNIPKIMERGGMSARMLQDLAQGTQANIVKLPSGKWVNENAVEAANNMAEKAAKIEALGAGYLQSLPSDLQRALREHVLSPVNGILRSSNRARAEALDEAFYNAPELPKGVVLYRGENAAGPLKKAAVGGDRFPLYLPTSLSKEKALQFKKFAPDGVGSFNDITPTGDRQFLTPFNFASEQEVILPRSGIVKKLPTKAGSDASYSYDAMYADGGSVRNAINAAVGGSGLVKAVGNTERAVGNIASGNASLGDLKALGDMASQLGYTVPGLSQALGIAGVAKAGYNMASDPSGMNAAKLAATVNPIAAQALGLYQAATDPTPGTLVDAVSSFNPIARAYNGLANSFNFATIGQVMANLGKIADPNAPAQLRDMFSNNPNSAANAREANEMAARLGIDPMDAMMRVLNADEAAVPGPTVADAINAYNQAQALQTNPSLNPASPDFMGPQADGGSEGGSGGYGYGGLGGIGGMG